MASDEDPEDDVLLDSDETSEDADTDPFANHDDEAPESWSEFNSVFILRARQPFEDWVRQLPDPPDPPPGPGDLIRAFLTPSLPTQAAADLWLAEHYDEMFECWLRSWADRSDWPADRSFRTFQAWFEVVFSSEVEDMTYEGGAGEEDYATLPAEVTCAPLSLREVRDRFLDVPEDSSLHVDIESGELFAFTAAELDAIDAARTDDLEMSDADLETLQDAFDSGTLALIGHRSHLPLTDLMHDFAEQLEPGTLRNRLLNALQGRKARRRFNEAIDLAGLRRRWERWFRRAVAGLMAATLTTLGIPYVDDLESVDTEPEPADS
jgi:hypothetical protein